MNNEQEKKVWATPQITEIGQLNDFVQQNGLFGLVDGPSVNISGIDYSPHAS